MDISVGFLTLHWLIKSTRFLFLYIRETVFFSLTALNLLRLVETTKMSILLVWTKFTKSTSESEEHTMWERRWSHWALIGIIKKWIELIFERIIQDLIISISATAAAACERRYWERRRNVSQTLLPKKTYRYIIIKKLFFFASRHTRSIANVIFDRRWPLNLCFQFDA